jgi:hypothetical protein
VQSFDEYQVLHNHEMYANREEPCIYKRPVKPMMERSSKTLEEKMVHEKGRVGESVSTSFYGAVVKVEIVHAPLGSLSERSLRSSCEYSSFSC